MPEGRLERCRLAYRAGEAGPPLREICRVCGCAQYVGWPDTHARWCPRKPALTAKDVHVELKA
jgi:hypothetical protein